MRGAPISSTGRPAALSSTFVSPIPEEEGRFGYSVSGVEDQSGDGRGDVVISAHNEDGGAEDAGRAYVFDGIDQEKSPSPHFYLPLHECGLLWHVHRRHLPRHPDGDEKREDVAVGGLNDAAAYLFLNGARLATPPSTGFAETDRIAGVPNDGRSRRGPHRTRARGGAPVAVAFRIHIRSGEGPSNLPPTASGATATTPEGVSVLIDVLAGATDPDGDALTLESVSAPAHGTAAIEKRPRAVHAREPASSARTTSPTPSATAGAAPPRGPSP